METISIIRKVLRIFLLATIAGLALAFVFSPQGTSFIKWEKVCEKPIRYSIGSFDERFGMDRDEFIGVARDAERIWEGELNLNLLDYDPEAEFVVNLVYDERQEQSKESLRLQDRLEVLKEKQGDLNEEYEVMKVSYDSNLVSYEKALASYEKDVQDYNKEVEYWNEKGGAPKDEYEKLEDERKRLKKLSVNLDERQAELEELSEEINQLVSHEGKIVTDYNMELGTYEFRFGQPKEFSQGEYTGTEINIYQFFEETDLLLVLAHEFGHALEIDHVGNPESIMYYLMEKQKLGDLKLTNEDVTALREKCNLR